MWQLYFLLLKVSPPPQKKFQEPMSVTQMNILQCKAKILLVLSKIKNWSKKKVNFLGYEGRQDLEEEPWK